MLEGLKMKSKARGVRFLAADGKEMGNYGRKTVMFKAGFSRQA